MSKQNGEEKDFVEKNEEKKEKETSEIGKRTSGGYVPMTPEQIRKTKLILFIVFSVVAAIILIVRFVK